jgi:hypothetical protein
MEPKSRSPSWNIPEMSPLRARVVGSGMREQIGYCWQKAEEYAARAAEAPDKDTRELFIRFRNSWLSAAKRYEPARTPAADHRPVWPSSPTSERGTNEWYRRPTDALTSVPAERMGSA